MIRTIKFRGKVTRDYQGLPKGSWVYGSLDVQGPVIITHTTTVGYDVHSESYEVDGDTIGEFTGLEDSGGREIYEGDIFEIVAHPNIYERTVDGERRTIHPGVTIHYIVAWNSEDAGFYARIMHVDPKGVKVGSTTVPQQEIAVGDLHMLHSFFNEHRSEVIIGTVHDMGDNDD